MKSPKTVLVLILILSAFLNFYMLGKLYPFIGDQGWFYLSARDLINGDIPLVGITASYTWLSQGALWTYMLAPVLWLFKYDPVGGAYLSATIGVLSVFMIYKVSKELFKSEEMGIIASALMATSPLSIAFARTPYHTSPITFAVLVFILALYRFSVGKYVYLTLVAFMLGILYNLALVTVILWILTFLILIKVRYFNLKIYFISFIAFLIPMIPMIFYDFQMKSGYYQITALPRLVKVGLFDSGGFNPRIYLDVLDQFLIYNQQLIFSPNKVVSIFIVSFGLLFILWQSTLKRKNKFNIADYILGLWVFISIIGIFLNKTPSAAYLPMFLPGVILLIAYSGVKIIQRNIKFRSIIYIIFLTIIFTNLFSVISTKYSVKNSQTITISNNKIIASEIVEQAAGRKYNLISVGPGSEFENNLKNFEYLTWWMGNGPSEKKENLKFIIKTIDGKIILLNEENN